MRLTLGDVVEATGGKLISGSSDQVFTGVATDSRTVRRGELFFALRGERFDGHDYLKAALARGAAGAVIEKSPPPPFDKGGPGGICVIRVSNTLEALGDLASFWRRRFPIPVVAVTGSNGKTTTKEMIAALLSQRYRVLKTEKNFNNLIGLPLTLFRLTSRHQVAVVEMGMSVPGEIARLAEIAAPQVGVITNIGRAHLAGLRSLAGVARAKGKLLAQLPKNGLAVLNGDDRFFGLMKKLSPAPIQSFGWSPRNSVRGLQVEWLGLRGIEVKVRRTAGTFSCSLRLLGRHNATNALAAIAVGDYFGISATGIRQAFRHLRPQASRMEMHRTSKGIVIDDSYNANPDSMREAFDFVRRVRGKRRVVAILGEMRELGKYSRAAHREIGARTKGFGLVVGIGRFRNDVEQGVRRAGAGGNQVILFKDLESACADLPRHLKRRDLILVKGSRGAHLERVVETLRRAE